MGVLHLASGQALVEELLQNDSRRGPRSELGPLRLQLTYSSHSDLELTLKGMQFGPPNDPFHMYASLDVICHVHIYIYTRTYLYV